MEHTDHPSTHVISVILNLHQEEGSKWALQIYDHYMNLHEVVLKPGEIVLYESATLPH